MRTGNRRKESLNAGEERNLGHVHGGMVSMTASQIWKRHISNASSEGQHDNRHNIKCYQELKIT